MKDYENRILTMYFGQPDQEDCSCDSVPDGALSLEGKKKILVPQVTSMTKYLFASSRLKMYSFLNRCLRNGTLRRIVGFQFFNRILNKDCCCFSHVSFWRIDRNCFWADVEVVLRLDTIDGPRVWKGFLSLWCSFEKVFTCSVEDLSESVDRREEGYDMLSPFLIPYFTNRRVDQVAEDLWTVYRQEAIALPGYRDPVKLAERMGLSVKYYPLFDHKGIGAVLFFADGELLVREEKEGFEEDTAKAVFIEANTIVVNTNSIRVDYSAFDVYHECFHYEYHYLFYRLQDMYNTDIRRIKSVEVVVNQEAGLSDPVYFMEKQANRGAYGLMMPASATEEMIKEECEKISRFRHAGEKYELAGKAISKALSLPHFRVRARMIQLGHLPAKGALNYADQKLIQPFAFDTEALREEQHTFVIDRETVTSLCRDSDEFLSVMQSGKYIYADGHVVRNDPRFVRNDRDQLLLTPWANSHVDECCLRFVRVYVQQNLGRYIFGRMYYDADYVRQTQFYLGDLINKEHLDELDAKHKYCREFPVSFREAFDLVRKKKEISLESLAERLNMEYRTLLRWLDDPKKCQNEDFITMLCLIFELPDWISRMLFKRAHVQLDEDNRRHQALQHILRVMSADGIEKANEYLAANSLSPLSI